MNRQPKYCMYATLLDRYEGYINSSRIYNEYWGFSENPPHTEEEFREIQRMALIDTINRVPFDSEDADRGTAFNEVVDCIINRSFQEIQEGVFMQNTGKVITIILNDKQEAISCINGHTFTFPLTLCKEFAGYFKGATTQLRTEGILNTRYGDVLLYGYIDELMPVSVHDIKMTKRYSVGKFRHNWQHLVYPYCLNQQGNNINDFEYNVAHINILKSGFFYDTYTEHYAYVEERDVPRLQAHVEGLIEFIEKHRELITDKKILGIQILDAD
ncbi:HNH endonuclease [Dysgonomonas termitidis]|uniref:HNH endonuclease n=1 Tax=Dysgonomonas termitidis TaxID=1516126 RepID=A0ABV9L174_9BACT